MRLTRTFIDFFRTEKAGGLLLIFCTIISLFLCNSSFSASYTGLWHFHVAGNSVEYWINDGLMTIFFLLIGLELEREVYIGELANFKAALLPGIAAAGGMLVPAGIYLAFTAGTLQQPGAGVPVATDIAFAIGILSLLGNRIPPSLKIMLTALAVMDDLGAIIVIAIFYTDSISWLSLGMATGTFALLLLLKRLKIKNLIPYLLGGVVMWYYMVHSGVHPTISGVLLAFTIPFGDGYGKSPSFQLQKLLHIPVAFIIVPLFALANTCVVVSGGWFADLGLPHSLGIVVGLVIGKPVGILLFGLSAVALGFCTLPKELNWKHVLGIGFLGGIGFTMSIFITLLAFDQPAEINQSKVAILVGSLLSAIFGFMWFVLTIKRILKIDTSINLSQQPAPL